MDYRCPNCDKSCDGLYGSVSVCLECACENKRIENQCKLAKRAGLPADLTLAQWSYVVQYFNGRCAYCNKKEYLLIEHFIPLSSGGGTTAGNIVPACQSCNTRKGNRHPDKVKRISRADIERVREYLMSL